MKARRFDHRRGFSPGVARFGRLQWRALVDQVAAAARAAQAGTPLERHALLRVELALRRTGVAALPVTDPKAEATRVAFMAAAWAMLGAVASRAERARQALTWCELVEQLLDAQAQADANHTWRRQFPGED